MYVCICQAVTDREIRHAVRDGVLSFEQLQLKLGVATCCGCCREQAVEVFHAALDERFPAMPVRALLSGTATA